ncbi:MAG TPA: ribosome maturation factor RimP [Firmicutes bacterium]|nr:ribosome maturation factor RimP [Bacillota bacterium]
MEDVTGRAMALGEPVAAELGLELVQVEYKREAGRWILRFVIDREGGVNLGHCEAFSRRVGKLLDEVDLIPQQYHLEVSSPGAERPLVKDRDFVRFAGERVAVRLYGPFQGRRSWEGKLVRRDETGLVLDCDGVEVTIPNELVGRVRLAVEF